MYQLLQDLPKKYNVTALVRLEKVRASQLLPLRKKLLDEVEIVSIKDKVAKKAIEKLDIPGIKKLKEKNYFFKMSKYQQALINHINDNPKFIQLTSII